MSPGAAPPPVVPLIDQLARLIEATYDIDSGTIPLGRFVVGDRGRAQLVAGKCVRQAVGHDGSGAAVLLRPLPDGERWAAAVYLPDAMVLHLERYDPRRVLSDDNAGAFAALVEEVDHLVTLAERGTAGAATTLLELEWHAAVTKYLVLAHFAGRLAGRPLDAGARAFVEGHVFHRGEFDDPDPAVRMRYREAHRLGWRFVRDLARRPPGERVARLRRFHRASAREKLERYAA